MMCFRKFPVAINLWEGGCEGVSRVSVESFLSHSAEKIGRGTLLCCVSENFWERKSLRVKRRRLSRFSFDHFLCHSAEKVRRETNL